MSGQQGQRPSSPCGVGRRASKLLAEVTRTYRQLAGRIEAVETAEKKAVTMQRQIDEVFQREKAVKVRLHELEALGKDAAVTETKVTEQEKHVRGRQKELDRKVTELAQRRLELKQAGERPVQEIAYIEARLQEVAAQSTEMARLSKEIEDQRAMIDDHAAAVELWQKQKENWTKELRDLKDQLTGRIGPMRQAIADLSQRDGATAKVRELLGKAEELIVEAEKELPSL